MLDTGANQVAFVAMFLLLLAIVEDISSGAQPGVSCSLLYPYSKPLITLLTTNSE